MQRKVAKKAFIVAGGLVFCRKSRRRFIQMIFVHVVPVKSIKNAVERGKYALLLRS